MQTVMRVLGLCVALLAASAAATPRISVSRTSFTVDEGFKEEITFTLDEPIICTTQDGECAVVIQVQNQHPSQIAIDNCIIKWDWRDWRQPRRLVISAVEDFVDDEYFEGLIKTDPAISRSDYYSGFDPADISLKTRPRRTAQCRGTGDPHYTTFDGRYWHVYWPGRYVLYKTTKRTFEVQVQTRLRPARHCAFAAREGNDVVVVWACNGSPVVRRSCGSDECRKGGFPKLSVRGNSRRANYYVEFASGAMVRADTQPYYMNMYLTAPGRDFNDVQGVCGNFNGNSGDDIPTYMAHSASQMFPEQLPSYDLFAWYPPQDAQPEEPAPETGYERCEYEEPPFIRPILNRPDAEDITSFIKSLDLDDIINNEDVVIGGGAVDENQGEMDINEATTICDNSMRPSKAAEVCKNNLPGFQLDPFIEDCAADLAETSNLDFVEDALEALERECAERASRDLDTWEVDENQNPVEPNKDIQTNICLNDCNDHGTCDEGLCTCDEGYIGLDCSIDTTAKPIIESLASPFCDTTGVTGCSDRVTVLGSGFWNSDNMRCRFSSTDEDLEVDAFFLGSMEIACAVPSIYFTGSDERTAVVSVTMDGENWSESQEHVYTWYDGICQVCDADGCGPNPESCTIGGKCLRDGTPNEDNICQECDPSASIDSWTWTYQHHEECGPAFPSGTPTVTIVGSADANEVIYTVNAQNDKVAADTNNQLTYTLTGGDGFFNINNDGEIFLTQDLDVTELSTSFNNFLHIVATDSAGNEATTGIVIDAVVQNIDPVFEDSYSVDVNEDVQVGTTIATVKAQDRNEGDVITYSWFSTEEGYADYFQIDENTGEVSVQRELDFEDRDHFSMVVRARDSGGQTHVTTLEINVQDVAEAPTAIAIDGTTIEENSAPGTVVGTLSTEDPDDVDGTQSFTYTTTSSEFAIQGSQLVSVFDSFDFEDGQRSFDVEVTTTDQDGLSFTDTITITVVDVNEKPHSVQLEIGGSTSSPFELAESAALDSIVGQVTVQDDDDNQNVLCSLSASDNRHFEMSGNNLILIQHLDYEDDNEHEITVVCVDDGTPTLASDPATFIIHVTDVDDGPSGFALVDENLSIDEDAAVGSVVARVVAIDQDGGDNTFDFEVTKGKFAVSGAPDCSTLGDGSVRCEVDLSLTEALNFEENQVEELTISADSNGRIGSERLVIPINNINEPVSAVEWADGVNDIPENAEAGALVGTLLVVDPDNTAGVTYLFELLSHTDTFELQQLVASQNRRRRRSGEALAYAADLVVKDPSALNYEDEQGRELTIEVRITDSSEPPVSSTVSTTVQVTDAPLVLNSNPDMPSVSEATPVGTEIATISLEGNDHPNVPYTISLVHDPTGSFRLDGDKLVLDSALNFEVAQQHDLVFEVDTLEATLPTFHVIIQVTNANDLPVITLDSSSVEVNSDLSIGQTVLAVVASDEDNTNVDVQLEVAAASDPHAAVLLEVFGFRPNTNSVYVKKTPSSAGLANGVYHMTLSATSGSDTVTADFTITIVDDCASNECAADETCVDRFNSYDCCMDGSCVNSANPDFDGRFDTTTAAPTTTANDDDTTTTAGGDGASGGNTDLRQSTSSDSSASTGLIVGAVVGGVCLIALIAVAVILVQRRRSDPALLFHQDGSKTYMNNPTYRSPQEPVYAETDPQYQTVAFVPGVSNPLYEWYQPDMTRAECTERLTEATPGTFFVRDSKATPGWHMIGVRTESAVVHEKIKRSDDGTYELLPASSAPQPAFRDVPTLVSHYTEPRDDVPFVLDASSMSNPMYDMSQANNSTGQYAYAPGSVIPLDVAAPAVPIKDKERSAVAQVAAMDEGELYTNTTDAQAALNSSA